MNKKQQEEQRRQDDLALKQGLFWVAGAIVLEMLLFLLNRYAIDFDATAQGVAIAETLRTSLKVLRLAGAVIFVGGAVMAVLQAKKQTKKQWAVAVGVIGLVVMLCAHVAGTYYASGLRMLYLLVPVLGGLALCYYIYPRDCFLCALPVVVAALGLWFYRVSGVGVELGLTVLGCLAVLAAVLLLKKNDGAVNLGSNCVQFVPAKAGYMIPLASVVVALAAQVLAAVAGGTVAYYLIFAMGAWLFALLVYYTVKML